MILKNHNDKLKKKNFIVIKRNNRLNYDVNVNQNASFKIKN